VIDGDMDVALVGYHAASDTGGFAGGALPVRLAASHSSRDRAEGLDERVDAAVVLAVFFAVGEDGVSELRCLACSGDVVVRGRCLVVVRGNVGQNLFRQGRLARGGELREGDAEG